MKKFIKTLILVICLIFPSLFCLTACENAEHEHEFATEWSSDASNHYHACTGDGCEEVEDKEVHTFGEFIIDETPTTQTNGEGHRECSVCHEISKTTISALKSTGLAFELNEDKTSYSLTGIGTCTDTFVNVPNKYNGLPVTAIKEGAFKDNETITEIVLANNITSIGEDAFRNCSQLESVTIQNGVTSIGMYAFCESAKLTNVTLPTSITFIGGHCFQKTGLTSVEIPADITVIEGYTFDNCNNLTSIVVPNGVTTIKGNAFSNSSNLETLIIPKSVKNIEPYIVYDCSKLSKIFYTGTQTEWNTITWNNTTNSSEIESTKLYFYSETQPTTAGNYWRYVDGVPTEWENITLQVNTKTGDEALTYGDAISYTASDVVATGLVSGETIESLGTLSFVYSTEESGTYTSTLPKNVGTYYVKVAGCISNKYNIT